MHRQANRSLENTKECSPKYLKIELKCINYSGLLLQLLTNHLLNLRKPIERNGIEHVVEVCGVLGAAERDKRMVLDILLLGIGKPRKQIVGGAVELHAKLLELRKREPLYTVINNAGGKVGGVTKTYKIAEGTIDTAGLKNTGEVVD